MAKRKQQRDSKASQDRVGVGADDEHHPRETNANDTWEPENSRGPRGYGHSQAYGGALGYQDETLRTPESSHQQHDRVERPKPTKIK